MPTRKTLETKKQHSFVIKKLRTTRFQGKKEESIASLPNQPGFINVDPEKVKIARDKIYEIEQLDNNNNVMQVLFNKNYGKLRIYYYY